MKFTKESFMEVLRLPLRKRIIWFIPIGLLLFIGIRSSFGHRPANISDAMYSTNRIVNEIAKNSLYSVGYAMYTNKRYANNWPLSNTAPYAPTSERECVSEEKYSQYMEEYYAIARKSKKIQRVLTV